MQLLHGLSMMSTAGDGRLDALAKVILDTVQHQRCVVDGIDLRSRQGQRILDEVRHEATLPQPMRVSPFAQDPVPH